jgi:hypothetical protein
MTWQCPDCGRTFSRSNQWHSCVRATLEDHFADKDPHLLQIFEQLMNELRRTADVELDPVQTSINLRSHSNFAVVYPHRQHLILEFLADREIDSSRIHRTQRLGPMRVSHFVRVASAEDIDEQLVNWLARAYAMQSAD